MPGATMPFKRPSLSAQVRSDKEFVFSPDSKHVAYFGRQQNGTYGIFVDGKFTAMPGTYPMNPTFTPDSRHLIWMDRPGGPAQVVYVDGRPALELVSNSSLTTMPGTWEMGADGTLSVVGQSGDSLKRYRITPGADTSIDLLVK